jgi:hypothetical protein
VRRTLVFVFAVSLCLALGAVQPRTVGALEFTPSGSTSKVPCNVGTVQIWVGWLSGPATQSGSTAWSKYGNWGNGVTCTGSNNKTVNNVLDVGIHWQPGDATSIGVMGTVTMVQELMQQNTYDWSCPVGPPTWNATGSVTAAKPVVGASGSADPDDGATAITASQGYNHSMNPTQWTLAGSTQNVNGDMTGWAIDENDPETQTTNVTTTVKTYFTGTGVEIQVIICTHRVLVTLEAGLVA